MTAKNRGVTRASDPEPLQKKPPKQRNPPTVSLVPNKKRDNQWGSCEEGWNWDRAWWGSTQYRVQGGERGLHLSPSCVCSECNEVLEPMRDQRDKPIHAVRRSLKMSCVRVGQRDVNACRNILAVFAHENSHRVQRSEKFARRYQQDTLRIWQIRSKHATLVVCTQPVWN